MVDITRSIGARWSSHHWVSANRTDHGKKKQHRFTDRIPSFCIYQDQTFSAMSRKALASYADPGPTRLK
jgi:hypothetical protein